MPKSDAWQDGNALDTMGEMDSTGSCDSVSDDSLEYLSAEEKACLMFLEETIQSLDTEDDSGLSNDESDKLPARGNVATKAAHLSASIGLNKLSAQDIPKRHSEGPLSSGSTVQNDILNYMVPTPFVLANRNAQIPARPGLVESCKKEPPKVKMASESPKLCQEAPRVPSEVSVVVIPPPHKIKGNKDTVIEKLNDPRPEKLPSRGPLSYEGLVYLRKSASMRKTHADESKTGEKEVSANLHLSNVGRTSGSKILSQNSQAMESRSSKPIPPPVAPKPKMKTPQKAPMNQEGATTPSNMPSSGMLPVDKLMNPEKVRLEALCKLGLLKEETSNSRQHMTAGQNLTSQKLKLLQSPTNSVQSQTTGEHLPCITARTAELINQPVQSCNPLHQRSVSDLCTAPSRPQRASITSVGKAATLECTGMGGQSCTSNHGSSSSINTDLNTVSQNKHSCSSPHGTKNHLKDTQKDDNEFTFGKAEELGQVASNTFSQNHQSCSSTQGTKNHLGDTQMDASKSTLRKAQQSKQVSSSHSKSPHVRGLNVPVHSIGKDRREALRKLGLLKN
ncbi:specifically androgen-regulated gene protein isoform X2 [Myxocyprinus asiaticus]|uniref:specifically androgen-regulated gene protein isoform X2 n=1 Tax=Myxocyprinus asiaticus TaxID=70543 RepID=UPI0022239716|nr:specifically androgen-regulated gene protein isoform X2 [Myxocyprinus asiaticus]